MLLRVKKAVEIVGGRLIGVVLNNVNLTSDSQYQYYTSYYSYYSASESQVRPSMRSKTSTTPQNILATSEPNENDLY
jgi:polysaccharide biosynthesis transport protein